MIITEPTLLLDEKVCRNNIARMASKARNHDLRFKPHMKTHQSREIGKWLQEEGVSAITVSSVKMARYFVDAGWEDVTIAFPVNVTQIRDLDKLAEKAKITVLVNNHSAVRILNESMTQSINAYIEIDTGSHRSGLSPHEIDTIGELIDAIKDSEHIHWKGFYSHPGHSYSARSEDKIREIHQAVVKQLRDLRNNFDHLSNDFEICIGDTPCCSVGFDFDGIDAISPGNFIFYDLMQSQIGSCDISDIAVTVACPVVDVYPERDELIIYGGAVHFSKERLTMDDETIFGLAAQRSSGKWQKLSPELRITALSQEHGTVSIESGDLKNIDIGDILIFYPVHSCLTANLLRQYRLVDKEVILNQMPLLRNS